MPVQLIKDLSILQFAKARKTATGTVIIDCSDNCNNNFFQTPYMEVVYDVDRDSAVVNPSCIVDYLGIVNECAKAAVEKLDGHKFVPLSTTALKLTIPTPLNTTEPIKKGDKIRMILSFVKLISKGKFIKLQVKVIQVEKL
jgi:hypothetical protein